VDNEYPFDQTTLAYSDPALTGPTLSLGLLADEYPSPLSGNATGPDFLDAAGDSVVGYTSDAALQHAVPGDANPTYERVVPGPEDTMYLEYWFFYYDNPKTFFLAGKHEGDWEGIQIHVDSNGLPIGNAVYAQHGAGEKCDWTVVEKTPGGRPIVYVA